MASIHEKMTAIGDAIRAKTGGIDLLTLDDMASEIAGISVGAELNFEVVGGTTEPENPIENMIWINTDAEITDYIFSATEPENPVDGVVWITVGTSSSVEFNALKNGVVQVYPISATQYVSGAWVSVTAKSYRGGVWNDWVKYLYNEGIFNTITGFDVLRATQTNSDILTFTSNGNAYSMAYSKNTIDVTNVKAINVVVESGSKSFYYSTNHCPSIGVATSVPSQNTSTGAISGLAASKMLDNGSVSGSTIEPTGEFSLDVSSISGLVYLVFSFAGTSNFSAVLNIKSIRLLM